MCGCSNTPNVNVTEIKDELGSLESLVLSPGQSCNVSIQFGDIATGDDPRRQYQRSCVRVHDLILKVGVQLLQNKDTRGIRMPTTCNVFYRYYGLYLSLKIIFILLTY